MLTKRSDESNLMMKAEIISKTLREMGPFPLENEPPFSEEPDDEEIVIAELEERLPDDLDIKTCEDFRHLNVECCDICHGHYAHYEMSVIDLPDGGRAWVCGPVKRAIYPQKYRNVQH